MMLVWPAMGTDARTGVLRGVLLCLFAAVGCDCDGDGGEAEPDAGGGTSLDGSMSTADGGDTKPRECTPGAQSCSGGLATYCRSDGTLARYECDPVQGLSCTPTGCRGACDLSEVESSYIGCDYYPTVTLNPVFSGFNFAVAVSNTSAQSTHVTITRGSTVVHEANVAPNQLQTFNLPWVPELKGGDIVCTTPPPRGDSRVVPGGAYRVRSDRPVTVYQFSPLEYELSPAPASCPSTKPQCAFSMVEQCYSYSNDASLLLPATALTGSYTVLSWPAQSEGSGFIAVTGTEDGTQVEVFGAGAFAAGGGIDASGKGKVRLDRGGVLELVSGPTGDISGTRIRADKPVQVISGHSCARLPSEQTGYCDHIEEAVFPEDTLGKQYIVTRPLYADGTTPSAYLLRVAAIANDTHVRFEPKVRDDLTLSAGGFAEIKVEGVDPPNLRIESDKPISIAEYMVGQQALPITTGVGDPSLSIAVPVEQYRDSYLFTAPISYSVNLATVVAKRGATVRVDGRTLLASEFVAVGASDYGVANVVLDNTAAVHSVVADQEVGLTVYGYGLYTSYMYPGGADLERITVPILI
jgi:hypothetical protein